MSLLTVFLVFLVSLAALVFVSERLINTLSDIGQRIGVSEVILGFILVAIGTSLPELVSSLMAVQVGDVELATANLFGSNLTNAFLVGGVLVALSPSLLPPPHEAKRRRQQGWLMVIAGVLAAFCLFKLPTLWSAVVLTAFGLFSLVFLLKTPATEAPDTEPEEKSLDTATARSANPLWLYSSATFWLTLLVVSGYATVQSVESIAKTLNVSATLAGVAFLALGTSLPELVTMIVAVRQGKAKVALATLYGSNLVNVTLILGITLFYAGPNWAGFYAGPDGVGFTADQMQRGFVLALSALVASLVLAFLHRVPNPLRQLSGAVCLGAYGVSLWLVA